MFNFKARVCPYIYLPIKNTLSIYIITLYNKNEVSKLPSIYLSTEYVIHSTLLCCSPLAYKYHSYIKISTL